MGSADQGETLVVPDTASSGPGAVTTGRRRAPKKVRRQQLIDATIASIARRGFAGTTLAHVAKSAGLSQGLINLHFKSKEALLVETLRYLRDDYHRAWRRALEAAPGGNGDRLAAVVAVDFDAKVCERKKLAVWFAFQSEAKARPTYARICAEHDDAYNAMLSKLCADVIAEGGYALDPDLVATGLAALLEGLWLILLVHPERMDRKRAREVSFVHLAQFFPRHFSADQAAAYK